MKGASFSAAASELHGNAPATYRAQIPMRATRFPLRVVPSRENTLQPVQGEVSERLREALRGFAMRLRALTLQTVSPSTPNPRYHILVFSDPTLGKSYATTVITYQQMFLGNPTLGKSFIM